MTPNENNKKKRTQIEFENGLQCRDNCYFENRAEVPINCYLFATPVAAHFDRLPLPVAVRRSSGLLKTRPGRYYCSPCCRTCRFDRAVEPVVSPNSVITLKLRMAIILSAAYLRVVGRSNCTHGGGRWDGTNKNLSMYARVGTAIRTVNWPGPQSRGRTQSAPRGG